MIAPINKQPIIRLKTETIQPYWSFVQFVKHKMLYGYEVLCKITNCYVCSNGYLWSCSDLYGVISSSYLYKYI